jgi:hypothetical protein
MTVEQNIECVLELVEPDAGVRAQELDACSRNSASPPARQPGDGAVGR